MLEFAVKAARHEQELNQDELAQMRALGFTDADLLAIIYWVANVNLANTLTANVGLALHEGMDAIFVEDESPQVDASSQRSLGGTHESLRAGWQRASIPAMEGADLEWLNSDPLSWADLQGRPLLFLHLDLTHANTLHSIPQLSRLHRAMGDKLVVIALQAGEFSLGKDRGFTLAEIGRLGISFPVVFDPDYRRMAGANNRFWPSLQLIDRDGFVRFRQYGPAGFGALAEQLLSIVDGVNAVPAALEPEGDDPGEQLWLHPDATPELYTTFRGGNRKGGRVGTTGEVKGFNQAEVSEPDYLYIEGEWSMETDGLVLASKTGRMHFRYHAQRLGVLVSSSDTSRSRILLSLDGEDIDRAARGRDLDDLSQLDVGEPRFHWLVEHHRFDHHHLDVQISGPGTKVFRFNFLPFRGEPHVFMGA